MGLIAFLFGKKPKINFTRDGKTSHTLDPKKWAGWNNRFSRNPEYDWREHTGKVHAPHTDKTDDRK